MILKLLKIGNKLQFFISLIPIRNQKEYLVKKVQPYFRADRLDKTLKDGINKHHHEEDEIF